MRDPSEQYADFPKRIAYLIDPEGKIVNADEVSNPDGYGAEALSALAAAQR